MRPTKSRSRASRGEAGEGKKAKQANKRTNKQRPGWLAGRATSGDTVASFHSLSASSGASARARAATSGARATNDDEPPPGTSRWPFRGQRAPWAVSVVAHHLGADEIKLAGAKRNRSRPQQVAGGATLQLLNSSRWKQLSRRPRRDGFRRDTCSICRLLVPVDRLKPVVVAPVRRPGSSTGVIPARPSAALSRPSRCWRAGWLAGATRWSGRVHLLRRDPGEAGWLAG